jgi:hypothetical protein
MITTADDNKVSCTDWGEGAAGGGSRMVVADPSAWYFEVGLSERGLLPDDGARLDPIRCADWLNQRATAPPT